jgi:lysophospholipase L1-like esterase
VPLQTHARHYRIVDEPLSGVHTLRVVKRTEAWVGRIQVLGLELPEGGMLETPPPAPARRLEIIGDSVTSGYGIEAPAATNTYHPATVNATLTYGWLAAAAVTADCRLISWSGRGVWRNVDGSTNGTLPELYSRALPWEPASVWDLAQWVPQAVVITLGANDFGIGSPPNPIFAPLYRLVNRVRDAYGEPAIFCCLSSTPNDDWPIGQYRRTTLRTWLTHIVNGFAPKE